MKNLLSKKGLQDIRSGIIRAEQEDEGIKFEVATFVPANVKYISDDVKPSDRIVFYNAAGEMEAYHLKTKYISNGNLNVDYNILSLSTHFHKEPLGTGGGTGGAETDPIYLSEKGQPLGNATLGIDGIVLPAQLPQTAFTNLAAFPVTGAEGLIYIAKDTDITYVWDLATTAYKPVGVSTITTTATAATGIATPAQETAFGIGINKNTTTGEVWFKDPLTLTTTKIEEVAPTVLVTTDVTFTGVLTPAEELTLLVGISRNLTTGEAWSKTSDGKVTKIEKLDNSICVISPLTAIAANGSYTYNHGLNDAAPLVQVIDAAGLVVTSAVNISTTIVDADNVKVDIGSVAGSFKVKVCTGSFTNLAISGGGSIPAFTPIAGDASHLAINSTTYQGAIDELSVITNQNRNNMSRDVHFGFGVGQVTAGNHFDKSSDEIWFYTPINPLGSANGKYAFLKIDEGTSPATPLIIEIIRKKRDGTDYATPYHTFTVPANTGSTVPFEIVNQLSFSPILEGEVLYIKLSASAPALGFTIGLAYIDLF